QIDLLIFTFPIRCVHTSSLTPPAEFASRRTEQQSFAVRERLIIQCLHEYRTIDRDIRQQGRMISGKLV
ncbi:hypothetical protein, partial [Alicyclobacillus fastidiosus]